MVGRWQGRERSFLASDESFAVLKELEDEEPAGAGRRRLRRAEGAAQTSARIRAITTPSIVAFYLSNVEQYLGRNGIWGQFCAQRRRPCRSTRSSTFIRSVRSGNLIPGVGLDSELGNMASETKACGATGARVFCSDPGCSGAAARRTPSRRRRRADDFEGGARSECTP